jgi:DNA-binding NarL/FixJ family response regulator
MAIIRIIIVEDHPLFSKGLTSLIISQAPYLVVGEARNKADALKMACEKKPDLAIVDLKLGDEDGMAVIQALRQDYSHIKILVLSMHDERYYAEWVLQAGAQGYIMKEEAEEKVLDAIKTVMSGKMYLSSSEQERLGVVTHKSNMETADSFVMLRKLTDRQLQVFSLIGKGLGTIEIANKLSLSNKTVDAHKENIKEKLHCATSQELRQMAIEWNNS